VNICIYYYYNRYMWFHSFIRCQKYTSDR